MSDLVQASVASLLFTLIFLLGTGLGFWVRHQIAVAQALLAAVPRKDEDNKVLSPAEQEAKERRLEAERNARMRAMGMPYEGV